MTARWTLRQVQRDAHLVSRTAGDLAAATRGPGPLVKRVAARSFARALIRAFRTTR